MRIEQQTRSGSVSYFEYAGATYSVGTLLCSCPTVTLDTAGDGQQQIDYLNITYTCAVHGAHQSTATRCAEIVHIDSPAFAWVEQRHERDRRVAWGMKRRTA